MTTSSVLRKVFEALLIHECRKINSNCKIGDICEISSPDYCVSWNELLEIARDSGFDNALGIITLLVKKGLIIKIKEDCYRSLFFDLLLRASDLRIIPNGNKMILSSLYSLQVREAPSQADRVILPCENIDDTRYGIISRKLCNIISSILTVELVRALVNSLKEYFGERGSKGFDMYQAYSILTALQNLDCSSGALIVAPTGFGKTEIFTTIVFVDLLRNLDSKYKYIFVYPRKMLEIDQMARLVKLVKLLNKYMSRKITLYIRDGDTHELKKKYDKAGLNEYIDFRGIKCSENGKLYIKKTANGPKIVCKTSKGEELYNFVIPFPDPSINAKDADIIITNLDTLFFASFTMREDDIDAYDVLKTRIIVFDEIHEYDSIRLAQIHYWIKMISSLQEKMFKKKILFPVVSSATVPSPIDFASTLIGVDKNNIIDLTYETIRNKYREIKFSGKRLKLYLFLQTMPWVSWETYLSELSALILYLYKAYIGSKRSFIPQAIFFINNVREINRLNTITRQALSLGSPLDILCVRRVQCSLDDSVEKRDHCRHYYEYLTPDILKRIIEERIQKDGRKASIFDLLIDGLDTVFGQTPLEKREEIYDKLKKKELGVIYATTTLELGVDYPYVSIIVNAGFDRVESMIQRIGRGGRSSESLWTMLAIVLARNNPLDYRLFSDRTIRKRIIEEDVSKERNVFISKDLSSVKINMLLKSILLYNAVKNIINKRRTILYGGYKLFRLIDLKRVIEYMIDTMNESEFREYVVKGANIVSEREYVDVMNQLSRLLSVVEEPDIANLLEEISDQYVSIENIIQNLRTLLYLFSDIKKDLLDKINRTGKAVDSSTRKIIDRAVEVNNVIEDYVNLLKKYLSILEHIVPEHVDEIIYYTRFIELAELRGFIEKILDNLEEILRFDEAYRSEKGRVVAKLSTLMNIITLYDKSGDWFDIKKKIEKILDEINRQKYNVFFTPLLDKIIRLKNKIEETMGRV